jgi:hypothetical protein|tara:strand:+ start:3911 stop:4531 length:621 start_codon:yes stop_codon:yes gene_type:complete
MKVSLQNNPSLDFTKLGSIALVGSSGCILNSKHGSTIDSHDTIIRFNAARVVGFEEYVGSRTTIRIMNGHCFSGTTDEGRFEKNDPNYISSLFGEHFFIKGYSAPEFHKGVLNNLNKNYINFFSHEFMEQCDQYVIKHSSVGFMGLILSVLYSKNISVFGFDHGEIENSKRHYWEKVNSVGQMHSFNDEKEIFQKYESEGIIKIYK